MDEEIYGIWEIREGEIYEEIHDEEIQGRIDGEIG